MVQRVYPRAGDPLSPRWLRSGPPALVVRVTRVFGLAPLVFHHDRVRISRALTIYGKLFNATMIGLLIVIPMVSYRGTLMSGKGREWNTKTTNVINIIYFLMVTVINFSSAMLSSDLMKRWIGILKRVEMTKAKLVTSKSGGNDKKETRTVALFLVVMFLVYSYNSYVAFSTQLQYIPSVYYVMVVLQTLQAYLVLLTALQLIYTCRYINSMFQSFNNTLQEFLHIDDDSKNIGALSQQLALCELNAIYMEMCNVVDEMNQGYTGFSMLLIVMFCTMDLIASVYYLVIFLLLNPIPVAGITLASFWTVYFVVMTYLAIDPGHRIIQENHQTQCILNKLMANALSYTDDVAVEVKKLFMKHVLIKPTLSPLAMCNLSRKLFITIIGAAATNAVIVVQFRSTELSALKNNTENLI